jgi:hypothetical protein
MRHGTWTETGGGVGLVAAVVAGLWLAATIHHDPTAPQSAHKAVDAPAVAGVTAHAVAHLADTGHGIAWWPLAVAGLFAATALLTVAVAAWRPALRGRTPEKAPAGAGVVSSPNGDGSVIVLADYTRRDSGRGKAAGGGAA